MNLVARVSGKPAYASVVLNDATHITLSDSNTMDVNVLPVDTGSTVGALNVPMASVPPDSGEKMPLVGEVRLVRDAMPGMPDEWAANSPPSGEIAMQRDDPLVASEAGVCGMVVAPKLTTLVPEYPAVQKMEPFTLMAARASVLVENVVVVSSTPLAYSTAIV